jgi:hypothetical protein
MQSEPYFRKPMAGNTTQSEDEILDPNPNDIKKPWNHCRLQRDKYKQPIGQHLSVPLIATNL